MPRLACKSTAKARVQIEAGRVSKPRRKCIDYKV